MQATTTGRSPSEGVADLSVSGTRVVGAVVLVNRAGEVLMQLRDDRADISDPGLWVVPGGGAAQGESAEQAARREFQEETGYRLGQLAPLLTDARALPDGTLELRHFFMARYDGRKPLHCYEGQELRFMGDIDFAALPPQSLAPRMRQIVLKAQQQIAGSDSTGKEEAPQS